VNDNGRKDELICRCEEVTREEMLRVIREVGADADIDKVKRATRAGMGLCQGRTCRRLVLQLLSRETGKSMAELEPASQRAPLRPIEMKVLISPREGAAEEQPGAGGAGPGTGRKE